MTITASTTPYSAMVCPSSRRRDRRGMDASSARRRGLSSLGRGIRGSGKADFLAPLAREEVDAVDEPHPVAARAHDERVRLRRVPEEPDAPQQLAVRDARGRDDHLLRREVVDREDAVEILDAVLARRVDLRA